MKYLVIILLCAVVGAVVSLGLHALLRDSTGFLAENKPAIVGAIAGGAAVLVANSMRARGKGQA